MPRVSRDLDYEGELAFVIGRRCRHVPREHAPRVIAGYLVANDVSVRDWQRRSPTMTLGKSFDTHGPIGPWIVTADELEDPHDLLLRTWVNGEMRQSARTDDLIWNCFDLVATLSTVLTLEPGDVITTGTPAGVGAASDPPRFLQVGDRVRIEIERIGAIENEVIAEPEETALW
jgi:2-keto-4-pentenoate hydratase/2-oxohepta-3-ene-1,7-dioic acid hydratase in catechol pathway